MFFFYAMMIYVFFFLFYVAHYFSPPRMLCIRVRFTLLGYHVLQSNDCEEQEEEESKA